ncbi:hypothetical protein Hanom_Chr13g01211811 [Helianthus anomalus]
MLGAAPPLTAAVVRATTVFLMPGEFPVGFGFCQPRVSVLVRVCFGFMFGLAVKSNYEAGQISGRTTTVNGLGSGQIMKRFS